MLVELPELKLNYSSSNRTVLVAVGVGGLEGNGGLPALVWPALVSSCHRT
jgi:hypothetical protein